MHKRGINTSYLYFHSYPYTSEEALDKVRELTRILGRVHGTQRLWIINFRTIQEAIRDACTERYRTVLYRRFMMRIAHKLADKERALMIVTGENIGQVASQTAENMVCINSVTDKLIIRPLVTYDKQEIVALADKIGTYRTSILPYPDSCTVFQPKHPVIKAEREDLDREEAKLDVEALVAETYGAITLEEI
jgi:thiamine biosynthesis protein ThiI